MEARIQIRLTPRAARDAIVSWQDGILRVRVTAPPIGGKANAALERLLARALDVSPASVAVVAGQRGRQKTVRIQGIPQDEALRRLGTLT